MQHLFLTCPFVAGLWDAVTSAFGHRIIINGAVLDLWQNAMKVSLALSSKVFGGLPLFLFFE